MTYDYFDVLDWRAQVASLYSPLANAPDLRPLWADFIAEKHRLVHQHRAGIRVENPASPAFYSYNPAFALASRTQPLEGQEPIHINAGKDGDMILLPFAKTCDLSPHLGGELTLYWLNQYGGNLFLPFKDATSGTQTYGGGRYLLDTVKSAWLGYAPDGRLRLDFNFAYFPSCAHDARFVCPLSPDENTVTSNCWRTLALS